MFVPLMIVLAASTAPPSNLLTRRIAESAQAAQVYQGPLDGAWGFRDGGEPRQLEVLDPPSRPDRIGGAWRDVRGQAGYLALRRVSEHEVELTFDGDPSTKVLLTKQSDRAWRGRSDGRDVVLERRLARER